MRKTYKEQSILFEWPTKEQIEKMNKVDLGYYAINMFYQMKDKVSTDVLIPMMLDYQKSWKSEKRLRKYMKKFVDIFAAVGMWPDKCNQVRKVPIAEA